MPFALNDVPVKRKVLDLARTLRAREAARFNVAKPATDAMAITGTKITVDVGHRDLLP